jgi:hypothetical protein
MFLIIFLKHLLFYIILDISIKIIPLHTKVWSTLDANFMEEVYKYKDYEEYKKVQIETNVKKEDNVYAKSPVIKKISEELITRVQDEGIKGLCHGVRNGAEIIMFKKYLDKHYNPYS